MKKFLSIFVKFKLVFLLTCALAIIVTAFSPIYNFREPEPFSGGDIFNPYRNLDTCVSWKKANMHTHTKVKSLLNECPEWPDKVWELYKKLGYDIVVFSNHNSLTEGDSRPDSVKMNAYEHGYNLCQFHKLVFGSTEVNHFDNLLPLLASQCQWQFDKLRRNADLVQFNHPARVRGMSREKIEKLSGYRITELNTSLTDTEHRYWDWALSAGHYSFALSNDDLHNSESSDCIAKRCNFLCCRSNNADNVRRCLEDGCFYCMQMPDFGNGDWEEKIEKNLHLPKILNIGIKSDSTIFIVLDRAAGKIVFTGQEGITLGQANDCTEASYTMKAGDTYARITCYFHDETVLYTNPFARYDKTNAATPFTESPHPVNIPLTILWNLLLLLATGGCVYLFKFAKLF